MKHERFVKYRADGYKPSGAVESLFGEDVRMSATKNTDEPAAIRAAASIFFRWERRMFSIEDVSISA